MTGHPDPGTGADPPGDLYISFASIGMNTVRLFRQDKEPLHALEGQISGSMVILSPSHSLSKRERDINLFRPSPAFKDGIFREAISTSSNYSEFNGCHIAFYQDHSRDGGVYPCSLDGHARCHHMRGAYDILH